MSDHDDIDLEAIDKVLGPLGAKAKRANSDDHDKAINGIDARVDNALRGMAEYTKEMLKEKAKHEELKAQDERERREAQSLYNAFKVALSGSDPEPAPPADPEPPVPPAPVVVEPVTPDPVAPSPAPEPEAEPVVDDDEDEDFLSRVYSADELSGMSNERLQLLANEYGMDLEVTDHNRYVVIGRIISAQRRWCRENDVEDPNEPERTQITRVFEHIDVRRWNWVQWICAVVLGLIALRIAVQTNNWPDYIENSTPEALFEFFWVVSVTALGFFAGGWIGSLIDARLNRSRSRRSEEE